MSGSLFGAAGSALAVSNVDAPAFGNGGTDPVINAGYQVTLGDFAFAYTEVPDHVRFGLKEQMNIHKLVGGARVVDMVGDDPEDFTWSGTFLGPDSSDRANDLYAMEQQKKLIQLSFDEVSRHVVIASLDFVYKRRYWIDYTITCVVVEQVDTIGFTGGGNAGINADGVAAGNTAVANANTGLANANTATDAATNLTDGTNGQAATLEAGGVDTGTGVTFA